MPLVVAEDSAKEGDVVVAIDFGTSRTAWCWTIIGSEGIYVEKLDGAGGSASVDVKTPTSVLINDSRAVDFGYSAEEAFLEQGEGGSLRLFKCFKMALHKPFEDDPMVASVDGSRLQLSIVLQRSLEYVCKEAVTRLKEKSILLQSRTAHDVFWVLTLPAIWSDHAKAVMRKAAFKAGLVRSEQSNHLLLALEPECAAIASQLDPNQNQLWHVGSRFLIADCGGGTLDITGHEVVGDNPLRLRELMPPAGGPFGATQVDAEFLAFFADLIGRERFNYLTRFHPDQLVGLTKEWEEKKQQFRFNADTDQWTQFRVGGVLTELELGELFSGFIDEWNEANPQKNVRKRGMSSMLLSFNLMKSFFVEPVTNIVDKVENVILEHEAELRPLECIILAGGFSNCQLLQKEMRDRFAGRGTQVVAGNRPDLLIVQGAAVFGARPLDVVESRVSKYTFGVKTSILGMMDLFHVHGRIGENLPVASRTQRHFYSPVLDEQDEGKVEILITDKTDVTLKNEDGVQELAHVLVPFDLDLPFDERGIGVEFAFGATEIECYVYDKKTEQELGRAVPDFRFF